MTIYPTEGAVILRASAYGNGTLVIVGDAGVTLLDGSYPSTSYSATTGEQYHFRMRDVAYAEDDDAFIIVGDSGNILYSTSGAPPG